MSLELSKKIIDLRGSKTLQLQEKIIKLKKEGKNIIAFTVGEPNFNTPSEIKEAAKTAIDNNYTKYTAVTGIDELKEAISAKFKTENNINYNIDNIVVSNGGKQCLMNALTAIINEGDEIIIPSPYWLSYSQMVLLAGGNPIIVECKPRNNYKITAKQLSDRITPRTKAIILNSPNNPTGMIYSKRELLEISRVIAANKIYVISDEIYEYLNYTNEKHCSIASLGDDIFEQTITINGLSKSYAMTGWRIGYLGAPIRIVKLINKIQSQYTSNVCSIVQKAAVKALSGSKDSINQMINIYRKRRDLLIKMLDKLPYISYIKPDGAFYILIDFSNIINFIYGNKSITSSNDIANILLDNYGVAVIPCDDFGIQNCIRLSYSLGEADIVEGIEKIRDFLMEVVCQD